MSFKVVDSDGANDSETIGKVKVTLGEIMGARQQCLELQLTHKNKKTGKLIVRAEASNDSNDVIDMECEWDSLNRKLGCLCKIAPVFMRISR